MRLFLIRHGRPDFEPGVCYGRTDLDVTQAEHELVVSTLLPHLPPQTTIYTSPLRRCSELAARIASALDSPMIEDARLAEMHFGDWEMRSWRGIPREEIDGWANALIHYRPGAGESVLDVAQRVHAFYLTLQKAQTENAIVVCHAGTIRLLAECKRTVTPEEIAQRAAQTPHDIAYGELIVLG